MKRAGATMFLAALLLGSLCAFGVDGSITSDHPVGKVIKLIEGLQEKVEEEGKTEALANEKFEYWCTNSLKAVSAAIEKGEEEVAKLESNIEAGQQQVGALTGEIGELATEAGDLTAQGNSLTTKRSREHGVYKATSEDLQKNIAAMDSAITEISKNQPASFISADSNAVAGAVARLQASAHVDGLDNSDLAEFLQLAGGSVVKPVQKAQHVQPYSFKSGNVIDLLKSLKTNFEEQLVAANAEETNSLNAHLLQENSVKLMETTNGLAAGEKSAASSAITGDLGIWSADLKIVSGDLAADKATLAATQKTCTTRAREWEQRSAVREEEIEAMTAAIGILDKAGGVQTEAPTNPIPPPAPAFLQIVSPAFVEIVSAREQVLNLLRTAASATHSQAMQRLVAELTMRPNSPFEQVNNMIQKMIFRLMDEQKDEDKHKNWCDAEIKKTSNSAQEKADKVKEFDTKLGVAKARMQKLTGDINAADKMVAELTTFMKEAVEVREIGKKENAVALKDAQDAQAAIADATAVLKDFYKKSGMIAKESWEFVQRSAAPVQLEQPDAPAPEYQGSPSSTSIITLLGNTASQFAKMEADTRAQESTDQENFEEDQQTSKIEKTRRAKESEMKGIEKKNVVSKIAMLEKSRKNEQKELDMVLQYEKDLQPACVEGSSSYEDRKAARQQESDALRQAQTILTDAYKAKDNSKAFLEVRRHTGAEQ